MRTAMRPGLVAMPVLAASLLGAGAAAQQPPRPVFRAGVDVVVVDVSVLDGRGTPVRDLRPDEFTVTVDGGPRRIVAAQFIEQEGMGLAAGGGVSTATRRAAGPTFSTNDGPAGRLMMIVVDEAGVRFGGLRRAAEAAGRLLEQLGPRDRLGLAVLPTPGVVVPMSTNHARVADALKRVAGAAAPHLPAIRLEIGWAEALAFDRDRAGLDWLAAIDRECAGQQGAGLSLCIATLEGEANRMLGELPARMHGFEGGMRQILRALGTIDAPKTLILISEGLISRNRGQEGMALAADAIAARTSVYVLRLDRSWSPDVTEKTLPRTREADRELARLTLDTFSARTGGRLFDVTGSAEGAFRRVAVELSGAYLLAVEPAPADRDGRRHQIHIEVARSGVSVRARRDFTIAKEAAARETGPRDEDEVRRLLAAPLPVNELPIRVTTYSGPAAERSRVRVLVAAEVGRDRSAPEEVALGYVLLDADGRARGGAAERVTLTPLTGRGAGALYYAGAVTVDPGTYTLKLAVVSREGGRGSIEHATEARLSAAGPLLHGDLVVGAAPAGEEAVLQPPVEGIVDEAQLFVFLPLAAVTDRRALAEAEAHVEVAASEDGPVLMGAPVRLAEAKGGQRNIQVSVTVGLLPPGEYVARAVLSVGGRPVGTVLRPFTFAPGPEVAAAAGRSGGAMARARVPVAGFAADLVLGGEVVGPLLDELVKAGATVPADVAAAARERRFAEAARRVPGPRANLDAEPDAGPPFVRGLDLLARGEIEKAATEFRRSLRASPDVFSAAFYLGACYALGGRDDEAAGAWQTSLVGLDAYPVVYRVLVDAWLRGSEPEEARQLAEEAAQRWPDDDSFPPRLAAALAMSGENAAALAVLEPYLARHETDVTALYLAIRLLYEQLASTGEGGERPALAARLTRLAAQYGAAGGPQQAIVAAWVNAIR